MSGVTRLILLSSYHVLLRPMLRGIFCQSVHLPFILFSRYEVATSKENAWKKTLKERPFLDLPEWCISAFTLFHYWSVLVSKRKNKRFQTQGKEQSKTFFNYWRHTDLLKENLELFHWRRRWDFLNVRVYCSSCAFAFAFSTNKKLIRHKSFAFLMNPQFGRLRR